LAGTLAGAAMQDARFGPWGLTDAVSEPIAGGYNSRTWHVRSGGRRYVAKQVGGGQADFERGLHIAEQLEERGFAAGGPIRTRTGGLTVPCDGEWLALLRYVPGEPVPLDTREGLEIWGRVMGRVHRLLAAIPPPDALSGGADAAPLDGPHLDIAPWLRPALRAVTEETACLTGLTHGIIHNDGCEPRRDPATGELSVIDWNAAAYGPLVCDVGAARWQFQSYGNRPEEFAPFLDAYRVEAPIDPSELAPVDAFVRQRAVMAGWYFAWRIHNRYTVGADEDWNRAGLEQARVVWESLRRR
jgi:Ser/Thr protein kinase RdoA (MazF antagonist)